MASSPGNSIDSHIGLRVQMARAMLGLSLEQLADAVEISPKQMRAYEAGARLGASTLFAIAKILNQPIDYFYEGLPAD